MRTLGVLVALVWTSAAAASPEETAAEAREAEQQLEYDVATDLWMMVITDVETPEDLKVEAHLRSGILERIQGNDTAARLHFQQVLTRRPDYELGEEHPPKIRGFFEMVRAEVRARQPSTTAPAPPVEPEAAAAERSAAEREIARNAEPGPAEPEQDRPTNLGALADLPLGPIALGFGAAALSVAALLLFGGTVPGAVLGAWQLEQQAQATSVQVERAGFYDLRDLTMLGLAAGAGVSAFGLTLGGALGAGAVVWWSLE